jgi:hypothetical protein
MGSAHSVVEDTVERNSWGKSGSDWMCRFQYNGGLHHTSRDAPLETHDVIHESTTVSSAEGQQTKDEIQPVREKLLY